MDLMAQSLWRCACTFAAADRCIGDDTFTEREDDGSCGCPCHTEYSDDPENWHPLSVSTIYTKAESDAATDLLERSEAAEELTEGGDLYAN